MTTDTERGLWRECLAAGYGWAAGMLATDGISVSYRLVYDEGGYWRAWANYPDPHTDSLCRAPLDESGCVPVFTDPATLGCLLGMVREAWGDSGAHALPYGGMWWSCYAHAGGVSRTHWGRHKTEGEALLRALLAAPTS